MGSCIGKKIQTQQQQAGEINLAEQSGSPRVSFMDKYLQQPNRQDIRPYDPYCHECQYNVDVDGVIFDVIAPPDLLDEDNLEPYEEEE